MFLPTEPQFVLTVQENDGIDLVLQRPIPAMPESERYKDQTRTMLREEEARLSVGATDPTSPVGMVLVLTMALLLMWWNYNLAAPWTWCTAQRLSPQVTSHKTLPFWLICIQSSTVLSSANCGKNYSKSADCCHGEEKDQKRQTQECGRGKAVPCVQNTQVIPDAGQCHETHFARNMSTQGVLYSIVDPCTRTGALLAA